MDQIDHNLAFDGVPDDVAISNLFFAMKTPRNESQRIFFWVWSAQELILSDGFEILFEQPISIEEFAKLFEIIGMPAAKRVFERAGALIPPSERSAEYDEALRLRIHALFDQFLALSTDFDNATEDLVPVLAKYLYDHKEDFSEYLASKQ